MSLREHVFKFMGVSMVFIQNEIYHRKFSSNWRSSLVNARYYNALLQALWHFQYLQQKSWSIFLSEFYYQGCCYQVPITFWKYEALHFEKLHKNVSGHDLTGNNHWCSIQNFVYNNPILYTLNTDVERNTEMRNELSNRP